MLTAGCFDAFNATHSQTATRLLRDLQMYVAPTHTTWVTMLGSFEARIEEALTLILSKFQLESYQYRGQAANQNLWWDGNGPVERVFWKLCEVSCDL